MSIRDILEFAASIRDHTHADLSPLETLPLPQSESNWLELHQHLLDTPAEDRFWKDLIRIANGNLPDNLINLLIDRQIALVALAHHLKSLPSLHRLATINSDARIILGLKLASDNQASASAFSAFLQIHRDDDTLLMTLAHQILSPDMQSVLKTAIESHPRREVLLAAFISTQNRQKASDKNLSPEEFHRLFDIRDPRVHLQLALNPSTPPELLNQLAKTPPGKYSRQIRSAAAEQLKKK